MIKQVTETSIDISIENKKTFIVDERFIDVFKKQFIKTDFANAKLELKAIIEYADSVEQMFDSLDERIYLHRIISHPNLNTPAK